MIAACRCAYGDAVLAIVPSASQLRSLKHPRQLRAWSAQGVLLDFLSQRFQLTSSQVSLGKKKPAEPKSTAVKINDKHE
jgi:hypothetical protein